MKLYKNRLALAALTLGALAASPAPYAFAGTSALGINVTINPIWKVYIGLINFALLAGMALLTIFMVIPGFRKKGEKHDEKKPKEPAQVS